MPFSDAARRTHARHRVRRHQPREIDRDALVKLLNARRAGGGLRATDHPWFGTSTFKYQ